MTIKIEIPSDEPRLAAAIGKALLEFSNGETTDSFKDTSVEEAAVVTDEALSHAVKRSTLDPLVEELLEKPVNASEVFQDAPVSSMLNQDHWKVPFNAKYCSSGKTLYATGDRIGKWKKKKGVSFEEYDQWHTQAIESSTTQDPTAVLKGCFGGIVESSVQQNTQQVTNPLPQDFGQLMHWISEKQAAGILTGNPLDDAMKALHISIEGLQQDFAKNGIAIYEYLKSFNGGITA